MMNMLINPARCLLLLTCLILGACQTTQTRISPVEMREYQTRVYEGTDSIQVFKSIVNALQDEGFVMENSNADAGIIVASMDSTSVNSGEVMQKAALTAVTYGIYWLFADTNINNRKSVHVLANITETQEGIKTRLNFVSKEYNVKGVLTKSKQVTDKRFYHTMFTKMEKSLFLEQNI